jgi:hypothetical protein
MAVNSTDEEKSIAAKVAKNIQPMVDAINKAGFSTTVQTYAARFDRHSGANIICSHPDRPHWGNHLRVKANWQDLAPSKVTSKVRDQNTVHLAARNVDKIIQRLKDDLAADIAWEQRMHSDANRSQAWFDQACVDFKGFEFPEYLKGWSEERQHRFERLHRGMSRQEIGKYSPNIDESKVLHNLTAFQVMALCQFLNTLRALKAPYHEKIPAKIQTEVPAA